MPRIDIDSYLDDDLDSGPAKRIHRKNRRLSQREKRIRYQAELADHADKVPVDIQQNFTPSFKPAEHERVWLLNYLEGFYNEQVITDILNKVKGGKEANVYCCTAHPSTGFDLIAAKVYRPRMFRNLRNDARYRQGRAITDEEGKAVHSRREALAMQKKTRFGQELRQISWLESEFQTMQLLYEAGADVPKPIVESTNVILMEYVGAKDLPASTLNQVKLGISEAKRIFDRLVENLAIMLACHRVHADFSAYNILYFDGEFKIIDFPQAVDPRRNPDAVELFLRDVERLCQYFRRYKIKQDAQQLASDLWSRYQFINALDAEVVQPFLDHVDEGAEV
jgi:RIO kinase 1